MHCTAPFLALQLQDIGYMPFVIFGATTFLTMLLTLLLPVTLGRHLPQTVEEVVNPEYERLNVQADQDLVNVGLRL